MPILISVICPVLNEAKHIEGMLHFFNSSLPIEKELFIVDGGSTDSTRDIAQQWVSRYENIYLLDNPYKYVSYALNNAIPRCAGKFIVRLDAHSSYASDYFEEILKAFDYSGADIVGGPYRTQSEDNKQAAIAHAISTKFGIGNSKAHQEDYRGDSDSVAFGAWRREIFNITGDFDTRLIRNQDDEFHYRAKSLGLKIYQSPDIKLYYYPRTTLRGLFSQYYQYGFFKPLVLWKVPNEMKIRHLAPPAFVFYLVALPLLLSLHVILSIPCLIYILLLVYFSCFNKLSLKSKILLLLVYPTIHLAYGTGFWGGLFYVHK